MVVAQQPNQEQQAQQQQLDPPSCASCKHPFRTQAAYAEHVKGPCIPTSMAPNLVQRHCFPCQKSFGKASDLTAHQTGTACKQNPAHWVKKAQKAQEKEE